MALNETCLKIHTSRAKAEAEVRSFMRSSIHLFPSLLLHDDATYPLIRSVIMAYERNSFQEWEASPGRLLAVTRDVGNKSKWIDHQVMVPVHLLLRIRRQVRESIYSLVGLQDCVLGLVTTNGAVRDGSN